jgi:hypothetical protein
MKLGMELPQDTYVNMSKKETRAMSHWGWLIVGAKGSAHE